MQNPYDAEKGHTLVSVTFTAKNLDRAKLELIGEGIGFEHFINIEYDGVTYSNDRDLGVELDEIDSKYSAESSNGQGWKDYRVDNIRLDAGENASYKVSVNIFVEIEVLQSPFKVTFNLPTSTRKNRTVHLFN